MARRLTSAGRKRRRARQALGISDVRKASGRQLRAAKRLGILGNTKAAKRQGMGGAGFVTVRSYNRLGRGVKSYKRRAPGRGGSRRSVVKVTAKQRNRMRGRRKRQLGI